MNMRKKYRSNEVIVNNKSNFKSHLVKCQNIMDDLKFDQLSLKAIGKATKRASNLAVQLNRNNFDTFSISTRHYTIEILDDDKRHLERVDYDQYDPDDEQDVERNRREIPAVEITVKKNKLESDRIRQLKKHAIFVAK